MQPRKQQRSEKHGEHLGVDASANILPCHADLLHDGESGLILISLGDLLVVDDEGGSKEEDDAQHNANKKQAAVEHIKIPPRFRFACYPAAIAVLHKKIHGMQRILLGLEHLHFFCVTAVQIVTVAPAKIQDRLAVL